MEARQIDKGEKAGGWLCRRLESECSPLLGPCDRKINETLKTIAAWQTSFDCRLDDIGRKESKRQGHLDRAPGLALSQSERL